MAKKKKKKQRDFRKVHLKVGKVLKRQNETSGSFKSKQIVLVQQHASVAPDLQTPVQSLTSICQQLSSHYNKNMRKDAVSRLKHALGQIPEQIVSNLNVLLPALAARLSDDELDGRLILSVLGQVLDAVSQTDLRPHFPLLTAQLSCALTNLNASVKWNALSCVRLLLTRCPAVCKSDRQLAVALMNFVSVTAGARRETSDQLLSSKRKGELLQTVLLFLKVMQGTDSGGENTKSAPQLKVSFNSATESYDMSGGVHLINERSLTAPFDFPLFYVEQQADGEEWLGKCDNLCNCVTKLEPFLDNFWAELTTVDSRAGTRVDFEESQVDLLSNIVCSLSIVIDHTVAVLQRESIGADALKLRERVKNVLSKKFLERYSRLLGSNYSAARDRNSSSVLYRSLDALLASCFLLSGS